MGGNIGLPILAQEPLPAGGVYVLELSSYQIDLTHTLTAMSAALLNVTPDHLDRYDGFAAYAASKARLFAMQRRRPASRCSAVGDAATAAIAARELARRRAGAASMCVDRRRARRAAGRLALAAGAAQPAERRRRRSRSSRRWG